MPVDVRSPSWPHIEMPSLLSGLTGPEPKHRIYFHSCPIRLMQEVAVMFFRGARFQRDGHPGCDLSSFHTLRNVHAELPSQDGLGLFGCRIAPLISHASSGSGATPGRSSRDEHAISGLQAARRTCAPETRIARVLAPTLHMTCAIDEFPSPVASGSTTVRKPLLRRNAVRVEVGTSGRGTKGLACDRRELVIYVRSVLGNRSRTLGDGGYPVCVYRHHLFLQKRVA